MGDRAMAEIRTEDGSLFVYTHWGGSDLLEDAEAAVRFAKPRWDDTPYFTHIVVDQLTKGGRDSETGFGIMLRPCAEDEYNNDNPSVIIDLKEQQVISILKGKVNKVTAFEEIIK
jgi:hypothetical protein